MEKTADIRLPATRWLFQEMGIDPETDILNEVECDRLIGYLSDPDPDVRGKVALILGVLREQRAVPALIATLTDNKTVWDAARDAAWALGEIGDTAAVEPLIDVLNEPVVAGPAVEALAKLGDPRMVEALIRYFSQTGDPSVATVLGNFGDQRAVTVLIAALGARHPSTRYYAWTNIAVALRHFANVPTEALQFISASS